MNCVHSARWRMAGTGASSPTGYVGTRVGLEAGLEGGLVVHAALNAEHASAPPVSTVRSRNARRVTDMSGTEASIAETPAPALTAYNGCRVWRAAPDHCNAGRVARHGRPVVRRRCGDFASDGFRLPRGVRDGREHVAAG